MIPRHVMGFRSISIRLFFRDQPSRGLLGNGAKRAERNEVAARLEAENSRGRAALALALLGATIARRASTRKFRRGGPVRGQGKRKLGLVEEVLVIELRERSTIVPDPRVRD